MTRPHTTRVSRRRGFSRADLLVAVAAGTIALATAVPLLARTAIDSGEARSLANLRTLSAAHEAYSASFNGKQFSVVPEDVGLVGGSCQAYITAIACPPPLLLGQSPNGNFWWGYFLGTQGLCASVGNPPSSNCSGFVAYVPLALAGPDKGFGSFRLSNAVAFNSYVDGRFYSDTFYAPNDRATYEVSARYRDAGVQFDSTGNEIAFTSYCLSPAAMYHPDVFAAANGGYKNPGSFAEGFISPTVSQCAYPDLKTRIIEHNWNVGSPTYQLDENDRAPTFNASILAAPNTAFFDGRVARLRNSQAVADDAAVKASGGIGLWSRTTPFGDAGYFLGGDLPIESQRTSHTILTIDGLLGRDVLTAE